MYASMQNVFVPMGFWPNFLKALEAGMLYCIYKLESFYHVAMFLHDPISLPPAEWHRKGQLTQTDQEFLAYDLLTSCPGNILVTEATW